MTFSDYSAPLGEPMTKRFIRRHRLEKRDPSAAVSEPVEPIVYYLDPGTPEPIRSALLDGARWWDQAYQEAGFRGGFRVELRPPGISSHDVRYNVINWVHRSTRGWSSRGSVTDPRTGEILKARVTLGSLRIRQDYMIAEGLLSPYEDGDETPPELAEWALARIRQLSAHEVGHTLGLGHNYYNSEKGRISVMDYPHPLVTSRTGVSTTRTSTKRRSASGTGWRLPTGIRSTRTSPRRRRRSRGPWTTPGPRTSATCRIRINPRTPEWISGPTA